MSAKKNRLKPTAAKAVLLVELHNRKHGRGPSWAQVRRTLYPEAVDSSNTPEQMKTVSLLTGLEQNGFVTFTDEPGSLAATEAGVRAALARPRVHVPPREYGAGDGRQERSTT